jgi:Domain of unknown function (DUF1963)
MQPTSTEERARELERPGALDALRAELEATVVGWRAYVGGGTLHRPEPFLAEQSGDQAGRWLPEGDEPPPGAIRCGLDAAGRVVIARGAFWGQRTEELIVRGERQDEIVLPGRGDDGEPRVQVLHLLRDERGRVTELHDECGSVHVHRYEDDRLVEVDLVGERFLRRTTFAYDDAGALSLVTFANDGGAHALWRAADDTVEEEIPSLREVADGLAEGVARAIARAIEAAAGDLDEPRLVSLHALGPDRFPCSGEVLGASYLADMRRHGVGGDEALAHAHQAAAGGEQVRELDVMGHADPDTQRRVRQLRQSSPSARRDASIRRLSPEEAVASILAIGDDALAKEEDHDAVAGAVLREAYALLNGPAGLSPLPVVLRGVDDVADDPDRPDPYEHLRDETYRDERDWTTTLLSLGRDAVKAIWSELTAEQPDARPRKRYGDVPRSRDALRAWIADAGLERVADVVAADALVGVRLVPAADGRSTIGGVPELPVGMDWPQHEERAMTALAAIDCADLPDEADGRGLLPRDGTLLVFADLGVEDRIGWYERTADEGWFAVVHVEPGAATRPVEPPRELVQRPSDETGLLPATRVRAEPAITLRAWPPEPVALTSGEAHVYDRLVAEVFSARAGVPGHLLGHPLYGDDVLEDGEAHLLELASEGGSGFQVMDGGSLHLCIEPERLRARDWGALVVRCTTN